MFRSASGSEPARCNTERSKAPVIPRQRTTDELAHCRTQVAVCCPESVQLGIQGNGAADLGPPRTRPQKAKCSLSVGEPADGSKDGPGLGDAATQEFLAPLIGPDRSTKELEVASAVPGAPVEVTAAKRLGGRASRDDLSLVQVDREPNAAEASSEGGEEAADSGGRNQRGNRRQGRKSRCRHPGERGLCGGTGLNDGWVGRQGEEDRTEWITLLHTSGAGDDLQGCVVRAGEQSAFATIAVLVTKAPCSLVETLWEWNRSSAGFSPGHLWCPDPR